MIRRLRNFLTPMMALGIVLLALILVPGVFGQLFTDPDQMRLMAGGINAAPTWDHPLGTQNEGRDVFTYILKGMPNTLLIGLVGGGSAVLLGTVLGMVAGYIGGPLDGLIRNIVDIGLTIPPLAILIMIAASFSVVSPLTMGLVIALTSWMHPTRRHPFPGAQFA